MTSHWWPALFRRGMLHALRYNRSLACWAPALLAGGVALRFGLRASGAVAVGLGLPAAHGRTIIVGDVHGCALELQALLTKTAFEHGRDRLVLVGDLIGKGPHPREVVRIARDIGALAVRGNHEHGLLRWRARGAPQPDPLHEVRGDYAATVAELEVEDWEWLASLPYHFRLGIAHGEPAAEVLVVHAGLEPGVPLELQSREDMVQMRTLDPQTKAPSKRFSGLPWAREWSGPEFVVFGHDARRGLQLERRAIGLDTGAVYGGNLTALVLPGGVLVSVPAREQYVIPDDGGRQRAVNQSRSDP